MASKFTGRTGGSSEILRSCCLGCLGCRSGLRPGRSSRGAGRPRLGKSLPCARPRPWGSKGSKTGGRQGSLGRSRGAAATDAPSEGPPSLKRERGRRRRGRSRRRGAGRSSSSGPSPPSSPDSYHSGSSSSGGLYSAWRLPIFGSPQLMVYLFSSPPGKGSQ